MLSRGGCHASPLRPRAVGLNHMPPCLLGDQTHTVINLEKVCRVALMVTPQASGGVIDQAWEAISTMRAILKQQTGPMAATAQTVFLSRAEYEQPCRKLFQAYFGERMPATNFIVQPPCGGQALAIEAWALGGPQAEIRYLEPNTVSVAYDGLRWIHVGGIVPPALVGAAYPQAKLALESLAARLERAGASFQDVVRTWLYLGGITADEQGLQRYRELNRARSDFFNEQEAAGRMLVHRGQATFYPASTGVGSLGRGLVVSCLALQTQRDDVRLQPLENPRQTSAFDYPAGYSPTSPKFSRAMAVVIGDYATTWVSGTASIVNSKSVYLGDIERQTEQTIDNIESLISRENFDRHGLPGAGAQLRDLAKIRVYVKRAEDYEKCRAICERRFGPLPTIYAQADICRPELLVEIEGVAFSRLSPPAVRFPGGG
jgi:enamine deaminase RidA (YjgF/YER057c/UK114 family)